MYQYVNNASYEIGFHKTSDSLFQKCYEYNLHCHFHCRILLNTKQTLKGGRIINNNKKCHSEIFMNDSSEKVKRGGKCVLSDFIF